MRPPAGAGLARALLYILCVGAALIGVDALLYRRYLRATWTPPPRRAFVKPVRHVPYRTLLRLGWLDAGQDSSFVRFAMKKPPGVVRIGCVGDSFTYGTETGRSEDYPTILQRLFRERGYPQVEVINFGSGWYGFQQAFTFWDDVARRFDLDYVLLGPKTFFPGRDTTFDHASPATIYLLHARHVLEGQGPRFVEVAGDTFEDRAAAYRSFIPSWRYLRYDRRAPAFLACLIPRGRELRNPFYYYRGDLEEEAREIYRRLLRRMTDSGTQIVLGNYEPRIVELGRDLRRGNLHPARLEEVCGFPYRAPKNHGSPAGNRLLAEQFFAILTGRARVVLPLLAFGPLKPSAAPSASASATSLDVYERVGMGLEDRRPWRFVEVGSGTLSRDLPVDFIRKGRIRSLLLLQAAEQLLPEAAFYPLPFDIREGMPLTLRSSHGDIVLGRVSLLRPDLQLGVVDLSGALAMAHPHFKDIGVVYRARQPLGRFLPGRVYLGEQALFGAGGPDREGQIGLYPIRRRFIQIYPPPDLLGRTLARREGLLTLRFESSHGARVVVPLAAWRRAGKGLVVDFDGPGLRHPIRRPGG
ncbi:MAG: hypothetical protein HY926_09250 [Elusimicrobia bacterium]|nr:hypothetical protein [Elusimicrobiota bacterium]